ncbi:MAG: glycosyltransferase family 9 protein [Proteobacteria bacterium]|nr:glycosyltransferase family 9 protein [Pseudomonadota bacterium]MBI3499712.1 glycosyltransferase family 9 protein [Pseudomonadota bacterium]
MTPASILIYAGLELMGDGFIKLPFARAVRAAFPDARITWLAGKGRTVYAHELAPLVQGVLDEVIEDVGIGKHWTELFGKRPLSGRHFDLVIDTQSRVMTTLILRRVQHHRYLSQTAKFLFSDYRPRSGYKKPKHLHHRLFDLIVLATGRPAPSPEPGELPADAVAAAKRLLPDGPLYVGIAPGAGNRRKCWPLERFARLATAQVERGRVPVFILGPAEAAWRQQLAASVPAARFPNQDAADAGIATGPVLTLALTRRLAAAVSNDSGGGHILAEGGVPLVSLWGPTVVDKAYPMARRLKLVTAQQFGGEAMELIPMEAVEAALETLIADPNADDKPVVVSEALSVVPV